jgi:hypothetical protein
MSGSSAGIPPQIAPQLSTRICLAVSSPAEARTVLGEDAQAKGWTADELPAPGYALVRDGKRKPNAVKTRALSPKQVVALPDRPIWHRPGVAPFINLRKSPAPPAPPTATADSTDERVLRVVVEGPARQKDIAERSGLPKGTVSKVVARLVESGRLARLLRTAPSPPGSRQTPRGAHRPVSGSLGASFGFPPSRERSCRVAAVVLAVAAALPDAPDADTDAPGVFHWRGYLRG